MEEEFKQLEIGDKWEGFEVGKAYRHNETCKYFAFCDVINYGTPLFESFADNGIYLDRKHRSITGSMKYLSCKTLKYKFDPSTETDLSNIDERGHLKEVNENTFKVGDKVVVNGSEDGYMMHRFDIGDLCKIIDIDKQTSSYVLENLNDGETQFLKDNQFDKYVEGDENVSSPFIKGSNEGWIGDKVKVIDRGHQYKTHPLLAYLKKSKEPLENDWIVVVKNSILINDGTRECFIVEDHTGKEHIIGVDGVESYIKQRTLESVAHKHNLGNYIYTYQDGYRWIVELSSGIAISKLEYKTGVIPREIKIKDNNTIRAATLDEIFQLKVSEYFQEYIFDPEFKVSEYLRKKGLTGEVVIEDHCFIHDGIYVARMIKRDDDNYSFVVKNSYPKISDGLTINDDKVELKLKSEIEFKEGDRVIYYRRDSDIPTSDCLGMVGVVDIGGFRPLVRFSNGMAISIDCDCLRKTDLPFGSSTTTGADNYAFLEGTFDPVKFQAKLDEVYENINKHLDEDSDDDIIPVKRRYIRKKK